MVVAMRPHPLVLRAESARLSPDAIEALAAELPKDPERLGGLLEACAEGHFARAFTATALAALHAGVPVEARHLVKGARLLPDAGLLGKLSARLTGDVVEALLGAVEDGRLSWPREAVALFLAAHFTRERGLDRHRKQVARRARMLARVAHAPAAEAFLAGTAELLEDDELSRLIARGPAGALRPIAGRWTEPFLEMSRAPLLEGLHDDDPGLIATRRRAVQKVGRNDPCPCGSGKKYKRCCEARDQERLRDSSDVAGMTRAELRLHPEEHLTLERAHAMPAHELARLDPTRIDPRLHGVVLNRLISFEEWDALSGFFEAVGADRFEGHLWDAVSAALRAGRPDVARSFVRMAPLPADDRLGFSERLLSAGVERSPALDVLEALARRQVDGAAVDVACDLLSSTWPCLGILVARGVAPLAEPWDRESLLEEIGLARDRLDLPALDPTEGMEDLWGWSDEADLDDEAPPVTERERAEPPAPPRDEGLERMLADKEAELTRLRQELSDLHRKLEERIDKAAGPPAGASPPAEAPAAPDPRVAKLKERVTALRSELSQRHAERNQLRRQLERATRRVDALEAERAGATRPPADDDDGADAEPIPPGVALSFRVPVFGRRFRASAETLPDPVRRRAVVLASRIAAGDEAAFRGTKRLRLHRDLYRQRVGRDHRLIFRIHAQELEALDLVPRKDLERTIRELARG
jgi:uncharacterized coiled-coil protein SlyX